MTRKWFLFIYWCVLINLKFINLFKHYKTLNIKKYPKWLKRDYIVSNGLLEFILKEKKSKRMGLKMKHKIVRKAKEQRRKMKKEIKRMR